MRSGTRIIGVIDDFGSGGAQRQFVELMCGLVQRGYSVSVFRYNQSENHFIKKLVDHKVTILGADKREVGKLGTVRALTKDLKKVEPAFIIAFLDNPSLLAEIACIFFPKAHLLVSERNSRFEEKSFARSLVKRLFHLRSYKVVTNSEDHKLWLEASFPWLRSRLECVYNGVPSRFFRQPLSRPVRIENRLSVVCIGRISLEKNPQVLAEACSIVYNEHGWAPSVRWIGRVDTFGAGERVKEEVDEVLEATRQKEGWLWHGEAEDIPDLIMDADVVVLSSLHEGLPNAVCEALATGTPVIASDIGDNRKLLGANGERGFLFKNNSAASLAEAIQKFNETTNSERSNMGISARRFSERELSQEKMVDRFEELMNP